MTPFPKSSKWSMIDRYCVTLSTVGPEKLPIQLTIQRRRKTPKVAMPATIWLLVRLEMRSPSEMKQPPMSSRPR